MTQFESIKLSKECYKRCYYYVEIHLSRHLLNEISKNTCHKKENLFNFGLFTSRGSIAAQLFFNDNSLFFEWDFIPDLIYELLITQTSAE